MLQQTTHTGTITAVTFNDHTTIEIKLDKDIPIHAGRVAFFYIDNHIQNPRGNA